MNIIIYRPVYMYVRVNTYYKTRDRSYHLNICSMIYVYNTNVHTLIDACIYSWVECYVHANLHWRCFMPFYLFQEMGEPRCVTCWVR